MTNCFVTLFRLKMHMILFLDSLLDVVCTGLLLCSTGNLSSCIVNMLTFDVCPSSPSPGWMTLCPELLTGCQNLTTNVSLYFWFYIVFFNGLWVAAPVLMLRQSWTRCSFTAVRPSEDNGYTSVVQRHKKVD